jgi:hypothetical protein
MKKANQIIITISLIIIAGFFINAINPKANKEEVNITDPDNNNTAEHYEIRALKLPAKMFFAKEKAPLNDIDVYERIDRELLVNTYWQSNGLLMFKRTYKYFKSIESILEQNNIPDDFKYLALIESGLQNVTSPSGAKGFWQLMKPTAKEYGLEVNANVDERYHLEKATKVACNYLKKSKEKFGTWTLAAAAYNAGNRRISESLEKQKADNYYDLLLNEETARYVPRILAVKEILTHADKYGFSFTKEDLYNHEAFYEVKVDTAITDIARFAKNYGMSYKEFKRFNPWLRENHLNNKSRKEYFIKIAR